jgi:agmatinase
VSLIREFLNKHPCAHLSVDVDVLDPAYAPAVSCPEPDGISTTLLLDVLQEVCDKRFLSLDVSEVTPQYDSGMTAIQAAKIIMEVLCYLRGE